MYRPSQVCKAADALGRMSLHLFVGLVALQRATGSCQTLLGQPRRVSRPHLDSSAPGLSVSPAGVCGSIRGIDLVTPRWTRFLPASGTSLLTLSRAVVRDRASLQFHCWQKPADAAPRFAPPPVAAIERSIATILIAFSKEGRLSANLDPGRKRSPELSTRNLRQSAAQGERSSEGSQKRSGR